MGSCGVFSFGEECVLWKEIIAIMVFLFWKYCPFIVQRYSDNHGDYFKYYHDIMDISWMQLFHILMIYIM